MKPSPRIPLLAAALSFLMPGLGQLYAGRIARSIAFLAISCFAVLILGRVLDLGHFTITMVYEIVFGSLIAIAATVDAWIVAKNAPADYVPDEKNRPATYAWFIVLGLLLSVTIAMLEARRIQEHLRTFRMVGKSMEPALLEGDVFFVDHHPFHQSDPVAGELVVYRSPLKRTQHWTSRVIGLPGQTIEIRDHQLYVDGDAVSNSQGDVSSTETLGSYTFEVRGMENVPDMDPVTVPDHHVFLICDNRSNSIDSRKFGPVGITSLEGKLKSIYWPYSRKGDLNMPD